MAQNGVKSVDPRRSRKTWRWLFGFFVFDRSPAFSIRSFFFVLPKCWPRVSRVEKKDFRVAPLRSRIGIGGNRFLPIPKFERKQTKRKEAQRCRLSGPAGATPQRHWPVRAGAPLWAREWKREPATSRDEDGYIKSGRRGAPGESPKHAVRTSRINKGEETRGTKDKKTQNMQNYPN